MNGLTHTLAADVADRATGDVESAPAAARGGLDVMQITLERGSYGAMAMPRSCALPPTLPITVAAPVAVLMR